MCRVIDQVGDYKILEASRDYLVVNTKGKHENHGHFKKLKTCYLIIKLIQTQQVPKSRYLRESVIRIVTDIDYTNKAKRKIEKDRNRQYYFNSQKGVRK